VIVPITVDQLRALPSYGALTPRQQNAVEIFLATGDTLNAAIAGYEYNFKFARDMRVRIFKSPRVLAALADSGFVGPIQHASMRKPRKVVEKKLTPPKSHREIFDGRLAQAINDPAVTKAQVRKLRAEAEANGYFQTATVLQEVAQ
jgi:hypothetical protein